jgi:hypothetical protein
VKLKPGGSQHVDRRVDAEQPCSSGKIREPTSACRSGAEGVGAVTDRGDLDDPRTVVDEVQDPVGTATSGPSRRHRGIERGLPTRWGLSSSGPVMN